MKEEDMDKKIKMPPKFSTPRLFLDIIIEDDHDFILSLVNTKGWLQFIGDRNVHSKDDSIEYIKRIKNTPDLFYWLVRLKDSKNPIGIISFLKRSYLEHFDIGFAFYQTLTGMAMHMKQPKRYYLLQVKRQNTLLFLQQQFLKT